LGPVVPFKLANTHIKILIYFVYSQKIDLNYDINNKYSFNIHYLSNKSMLNFFKFILSIGVIKRYRTFIGKRLLTIPAIKKNFDQSIKKESNGFFIKNKEKYDNFKKYYSIPETGLSYDECMDLIKSYSDEVIKHTENKQFSGTIYQDTLNEKSKDLDLPQTLESLYVEIFRRSHMWNSLHDHEFSIANLINLQTVSCVADLFGGSIENTSGLVTTGGTHSIMTAARAYVNYGIKEKNLQRESCVIIATDTFHASILKAAEAYGFKLVLVSTNKFGQVDTKKLIRTVTKHGYNIVALFCSYPSYPYGTVDDINLFVKLAKTYKAGIHVDCCLGGFIVNFKDELMSTLLSENNENPDFQTSGVTSLSVDTHKNGLCPKGSSVLLLKKLGNNNLLYHTIYSFPNWKGGLYGTPNDAGSVSCVESFCALITMLFYGKNAYKCNADKILVTTETITEHLKHNDIVEIINPNCINVLAIKLKLKSGSTYRLCDIMQQKGYSFNALTNDIIHFCFTKRFISQNNSVLNFIVALDSGIEAVKKEIDDNPNIEYDGSARLYCAIDKINQISNSPINYQQLTNDNSIAKYAENYFFGEMGIIETIKMHFMAIVNPYHK
jgi:sphinganine-1-phosphate aldolase